MSGRLTLLGACILLALWAALAMPADCKQSRGVRSQLVVKAQPQVVYDAILALRVDDPSAVKQLSRSEKQSVIEEKFDRLPIIGRAICVYVETYTPWQRIDYRMIRSDKFKAFEGSWVVTPQDEESAIVELSSYIDTGLSIPFARQITDATTLRDVKKRLALVKKSAEANQQKLGKISSDR